jgi:hypothetical protein
MLISVLLVLVLYQERRIIMVELRKRYDVICVATGCTLYGNLTTYGTALRILAELEEEYGKGYNIILARETRTDLQRVLAEDVTGTDWADGYGLSGCQSYIVREVAQGKAFCVDVYTYSGKEGTYGFNTEDECLAFINGVEMMARV